VLIDTSICTLRILLSPEGERGAGLSSFPPPAKSAPPVSNAIKTAGKTRFDIFILYLPVFPKKLAGFLITY
jgi:hypothetical protein